MKTQRFKNILTTTRGILTVLLLSVLLINCSTDEVGSASESAFFGTGNFNFTGDFNMSFVGEVSNARIAQISNGESLPLSFIDSQGKEFFIGLRDNPRIGARAYTMEDLTTEGYAGIELSGEVYDTGSIGGTGTVTLTTVNSSEISGSVDMKLARPLNTADTVVVKGSFQLRSQ
ncbi:hypothetical protein [Spongiimicrobium sp. 2-473A-2-J]|uniref:hypothetical protein n=1 Tax=Eudoraea algarum TaxID=3417568 RepID=UPI003D36C4D9